MCHIMDKVLIVEFKYITGCRADKIKKGEWLNGIIRINSAVNLSKVSLSL